MWYLKVYDSFSFTEHYILVNKMVLCKKVCKKISLSDNVHQHTITDMDIVFVFAKIFLSCLLIHFIAPFFK